MAEMTMNNLRAEATSGSSRVMPVSDSPEEQVIDIPDGTAVTAGGDGFSGQRQQEEGNPQDAWLPITESRKGNTLSAAVHLLCSGIGIQALLLPLAFVSLGWFWGVICLCAAFSWQLYTIWLLVNLHESAPPNGIRYSRFLHLSIVAFGEKLGKMMAIFPTMYLSGGTCVMFIIAGGTNMEILYQAIVCGTHIHHHHHVEYYYNCAANMSKMTGTEWFLIFICLAIFTAQFFPNLNSLTRVSLVGSITALAYCTLLSLLSQGQGHHLQAAHTTSTLSGEYLNETISKAAKFRDVINGIGIIALAFRGHNLVLEIQGTMRTNPKQPSRKPMWRGVVVSYFLIALCLYPLAIVGYWAYGDDQVSLKGGILAAYTKAFQQRHTSLKHTILMVAIYFIITINYLCAFQIYAMPTFDNLERIYVSKKKGPCPRWARSAIKVLFGGLTYFIAVAFPFLPSVGGFIGSIALPLTLAYPCFMWIAIRRPPRFSTMWCLNLGIGSSGMALSLLLAIAALWSLITNGLHANFFNPN